MSFQQNMVTQKQNELTRLKTTKGELVAKATAVELELEALRIKHETVQMEDEANYYLASGSLQEKCDDAENDQEDRMENMKAFHGTLATNRKMTPQEFRLFMEMVKNSRQCQNAAADSLKQGF